MGTTSDCGGECVDLEHDRQHCGACGHSCGQGTRCCSGECVSVKSNRNHCGACGNVCPGLESCCNGMCTYLDHVDHCGGCGLECPTGSDRCLGGMCCYPGEEHPRSPDCGEVGCCHTPPVPNCNNCPTGSRCCDAACTEIQSNRANCGACDRVCDDNAICLNGRCVSCPPGRVVCGNVCCLP
jgi:hypothetical protein